MTIEITFAGDFVINNKVFMRTLAQTYTGMQKALERAYLDIERGGISKRETIRDEERRATEFYLESYREGSFISAFKEITPNLRRAIDRLASTINSPYAIANQDGDIEHQKIIQEAKERISTVRIQVLVTGIREGMDRTLGEAVANNACKCPIAYKKMKVLACGTGVS